MMNIVEQLRAVGGFFDESARKQVSCSKVADDIERLRKIEESAKQVMEDYQANRFSHENMMALIEALKTPNVELTGSALLRSPVRTLG